MTRYWQAVTIAFIAGLATGIAVAPSGDRPRWDVGFVQASSPRMARLFGGAIKTGMCVRPAVQGEYAITLCDGERLAPLPQVSRWDQGAVLTVGPPKWVFTRKDAITTEVKPLPSTAATGGDVR